jgi:hypothetical protein
MTPHVTIGRIDFGPRDSLTTLGALIDDIVADEELIEELCLLAGEILTLADEIHAGAAAYILTQYEADSPCKS